MPAAILKLVTPTYPRIKDTLRPYRLWNAATRKHMPYRCYKHKRNAHNGALIDAWWELSVGESIEVVDVRYQKLLGTYTKRVGGVDYREG